MSSAKADNTLIAYFGYGSLVNRKTLRTAIVDAIPARLSGWQRRWRARPDMPGFPAALLTVEQAQGFACDGLVVIDRSENLASVDAREARYRRVDLDRATLTPSRPLPEDCEIFVYVADPELPPHRDPPVILQSYLDAVMQGFRVEHGEAGLSRFLAETLAFDTPIMRDRSKPRYPRSVSLSPEEAVGFDTLLTGIGARFSD